MSKGWLALVVAVAIAVVGITPVSVMAKTANTVAVCGCGKVFVPDASTKYLTVDGKDYACCTEACHAMAAKDPAGAAKMSQTAVANFMDKTHTKMSVGNVVSVTDKGTKAICGCGKGFMIDETTMYLTEGDTHYACCTKACHEMASKDPAKAIKAAKDQMAAME